MGTVLVGNRNELGQPDEYEVPVTSQATIAPNFGGTSLYQEVTQPYETPLSLMRNNADEKNGTDNPYHILEAPSEVTHCIQCHVAIFVMVCEICSSSSCKIRNKFMKQSSMCQQG